MNLPNPVEITLPGTDRPRTFTELPVTIIDSERLQRVQVQLRPFMRLLTIWEGEAYAQAGDYTQAQVEARVLELLGDDPKSSLEGLFLQVPSK